MDRIGGLPHQKKNQPNCCILFLPLKSKRACLYKAKTKNRTEFTRSGFSFDVGPEGLEPSTP